MANQTVYVPFGGLLGDCGDYHGWIVAASPVDGTQRGAYQVPTPFGSSQRWITRASVNRAGGHFARESFGIMLNQTA